MKHALIGLALGLASCAAVPGPTTPTTPPQALVPTLSSAAPGTTSRPKPKDAVALAEAARQGTTTKIVRLTAENDPNNRVGRPGGPTSAAILYDSGAACESIGTLCGATIEVYTTPAEAQARSDYIIAQLKANPSFGLEYHTVVGAALLRVSGVIKPGDAQAYATAFTTAAG